MDRRVLLAKVRAAAVVYFMSGDSSETNGGRSRSGGLLDRLLFSQGGKLWKSRRE